MENVKTRDERRIEVAARELIVSRLVEGDHHVGYLVKAVPSGTLVKEFFSEDGQRFYLVENRILDSGELKKYILAATPVLDATLVLLLRQAVAEWAREIRGYERHLHSLGPVAIRLEQRRVNAPSHADWGHVACRSCGDTFALGYNRVFGDKAAETKCVAMFEGILAEEHKQGRLHQDAYELDA